MAAEEPNNGAKPELRIGSYRLIEQLGSGGMSSVFRALHADSGHEVAVKVLPRALAKNPTLLQRFLREAKSAESLEHPNIVAIFDRGVDQGRHYLVLEYVPGGDLHERVRDSGPMAIADAVTIVRSVAEGLRFASSRGLVHRDIKPANILVSNTGQVKLIDLGLALQAESEDERVTRDGTTVGTVDYMSPEQARDSRATNERSDMYSLGCTLYFLLTGSPPFPGGNLADKLSRHCTEPAPDPRKLRPDIPEPVARLVLRLMAKRPENRFENYDTLIVALDRLAARGGPQAGAALDALIDDDEDEAPLDAVIDDDEDAPLEALIDEAEDDLLGPAPPKKPGSSTVRPKDDLPSLNSIPMAELAALDQPAPSRSGVRPIRTPAAPKPATPPSLNSMLEEEAEAQSIPLAMGTTRSSRSYADASTKTWVTRCVVIGVSLVLFVIGVDQLIKAARESPSSSIDENEPRQEADTEPQRGASVSSPPTQPPVVLKKVQKATKNEPKAATVASWVEPLDPAGTAVAEEQFASALESQFVPDWATTPIPERIDGPQITVRRIAEPGDAVSLRGAFDKLGGTVVLADNGPLFEADLRIHGGSRLVRALPGLRPIVAVTAPRYDVVKQQPAVIVLDDKKVIFDGIDFVVKVDELPREQNALFLVRGGTLTLRNCSITVVNPKGQSFSVVRVASARPSKIRFEQTLVRGQGASTVRLAEGPGSVAVLSSVLISGTAPVFAFAAETAPSSHQVHIARSVLVARSPIFEWSTPPVGQRPKAVVIRALASTFACFEGASPASLMATKAGLEPEDLVQWLGESNFFAGWNALVATGSEYDIKVRNLSAARRHAWASSDAKSQEIALAWPEPSRIDRIVPGELTSLATARVATLGRVPSPSRFLHEKTVNAFETPRIPELAPRASVTMSRPGAGIGPGMGGMIRPGPPGSNPPKAQGAAPKKAPGKAAKSVLKNSEKDDGTPAWDGELNFDTADPTWSGDLGRFLNAQKFSSVPRVRVHVVGQGSYRWTPVRMPDGVSLEILVEPAPGGGRGLPSWSPVSASEAEALIQVKGASLVLSGVVLSRDRSSRPKSLVRVDDGHLVLERCRLIAPGVVDEGGGGLLAFHAPTTRPFPSAQGPFSTVVDRPVCHLIDCILITGGDPLTAEVGRGLVALSNCAIASGRSLVSLLPAKVARGRFEADLVLDHCTFAAERNFVKVGPWKGSEPGPDRPWLISSRSCAFVYDYAGTARDAVLLRIDPGAMSHGAIFWQGNNDAYEVPHFTVAGDATPAATPLPDVQRQWVDLWEANHIQRALGPGGRGGNSYRFLNDLRAGYVSPAELILDPSYHRDRKSLDLGADPKRLGIGR